MQPPIRIVAIMGATATGKSALALSLASRFPVEVVSMDSRQVYRGLDIGTGKVGLRERVRVAHHLIDVADPDEVWSAGRHATLAEAHARDIAARSALPLLAGGTGFYFRSMFRNLIDIAIPSDDLSRIRSTLEASETHALYARLSAVDPARAGELSSNDRVRILRALELHTFTGERPSELYARQTAAKSNEFAYLKVVLFAPRALSRERVAARTRELFAAGWPDEVARLLHGGISIDAPAMKSLGYRALAEAVVRGDDPAGCLDAVIQETQQYAKRQETFFRSEPDAIWIDVTSPGWEGDVARRVATFWGVDAGQSNPQ